jgi:hypothetical protein
MCVFVLCGNATNNLAVLSICIPHQPALHIVNIPPLYSITQMMDPLAVVSEIEDEIFNVGPKRSRGRNASRAAAAAAGRLDDNKE